MANIDTKDTTLQVATGSKMPMVLPILGKVVLDIDPAVTAATMKVQLPFLGTFNVPYSYSFTSSDLHANASMRLRGRPGENVAGWTLGFVQLKYIGTNQSRYRGDTDRDGSILVTGSNQILCRDTDTPFDLHLPFLDPQPLDVWYDSLLSPGGTTGPNGTNKLATGTVIPASGFLDVRAHLYDAPWRRWSAWETNTHATGQPINFLQHVEIELLFCTILVAQEPNGTFHMLKHFFWNVLWEWLFTVDSNGMVVPERSLKDHGKGHNIDRVLEGKPMHPRFSGKELDLSLPVSKVVTGRPHRFHPAPDWAHIFAQAPTASRTRK